MIVVRLAALDVVTKFSKRTFAVADVVRTWKCSVPDAASVALAAAAPLLLTVRRKHVDGHPVTLAVLPWSFLPAGCPSGSLCAGAHASGSGLAGPVAGRQTGEMSPCQHPMFWRCAGDVAAGHGLAITSVRAGLGSPCRPTGCDVGRQFGASAVRSRRVLARRRGCRWLGVVGASLSSGWQSRGCRIYDAGHGQGSC